MYSDWSGAGIRKGQVDHTFGEVTWQGTSTLPKNPWIATSDGRWKGQAQSVAMHPLDYDAKLIPEPHPDGTHEGNVRAAGQRDVRHPGV